MHEKFDQLPACGKKTWSASTCGDHPKRNKRLRNDYSLRQLRPGYVRRLRRRRDYGVTTFFMSDYDHFDRHAPKARPEGIRRFRPHHRTVFRKQTKRNFTPGRNSSTKVFPGWIKTSNWDNTSTMKSKSRESCSTPRRSSKLARCRKLNYAEIAQIARDYFSEKLQFASDFLLGARYYAGLQK